jgi:ABC-type phosphate transport system substrate-binding protein
VHASRWSPAPPRRRSPEPGPPFRLPIYSKWAEAYKASTGATLNYQAIGSGGGIKQISAKTVDFGASDDPLSADELEQGRPAAVSRL